MTPSESRQVTPIPASLRALVPEPVDNNVTIKPHTPDVESETMPLIVNKTKRTAWQTKKLAAKLKAASLTETLRNDSNFVLKYIAYRIDDPQHEQVRSPRRLIHDGHGDCDCYAVFLGTLLLNQGIRFRFRISQYAHSGGEWSHIYVVVPKDQSFKGSLTYRSQYYVLDPVTNQHNYEAPFTEKLDITMSLQFLDGIDAPRRVAYIGRLGACSSGGSSAPATTQNSGSGTSAPVSDAFALRQFVDTDTVLDRGMVPTQQLLEQNFWPYEQEIDTETNSGYFLVISPSGPIKVATVLTRAEADQLRAMMNPQQETTQQYVLRQRRVGPFSLEPEVTMAGLGATKGSGYGWLAIALGIVGIGLTLANMNDDSTPAPGVSGTRPAARRRSAPRKKSIPTVNI